MRDKAKLATPLVIFGVNPILVYVSAMVVARLLDLEWSIGGDGVSRTLRAVLYEHLFASWTAPVNGSLLFALAYVAVWGILMAPLYYKKVFIRI